MVNKVYIDFKGNKYKIKEEFPEIDSFSYSYKKAGDWFYTYKGIMRNEVLEEQLKYKTMFLATKTYMILFGK